MLYGGEGAAEEAGFPDEFPMNPGRFAAKDGHIMSHLRYLLPGVLLLAALTSCNSTPPATSASIATSSSTTEVAIPTSPITPTTISTSSPTSGASTPILLPEDLLTAEEASGMVGLAVTLTGVSDRFTETGELYADYTYDFPSGSTALASLYLTQNALISESALKLGHNAKWAYEESKKPIAIEEISFPGFTSKALNAFYTKNNMEVSVLFGDYYFLVVFMMDADDAATLALNKSIASHIIAEIGLAGVSFTGSE
jgi:hypothetical protein